MFHLVNSKNLPPSDFKMTFESLISMSDPCSQPVHPTFRPCGLGLDGSPTLLPALENCASRGWAIFKGLRLHPLEGFQRLCPIRGNVILSRLLRQVLFTLGSPPRCQLRASNTFYGLGFGQTRIFPPSSSNASLRSLPSISSSCVTNAFPSATSPAENGLLAYTSC